MREQRAKFTEIALRVVRSGTLRDPNGFDIAGAAKIACRYRQPGHAVPLDLFISEGSAADIGADMLGWDEFHRGTLTLHRLAGDHATMLQLPAVEQLARSMLELVRNARTSTRLGPPVATGAEARAVLSADSSRRYPPGCVNLRERAVRMVWRPRGQPVRRTRSPLAGNLIGPNGIDDSRHVQCVGEAYFSTTGCGGAATIESSDACTFAASNTQS